LSLTFSIVPKNWQFVLKGIEMAKCATCGKATVFGHNRSFSQRATNRMFKPNLQKITIVENGKSIQKTLCAKCIRTMAKSN